MNYMFSYSEFDQDIGDWDISNVTKMSHMFYNSQFSHNLPEKWQIRLAADIDCMYTGSKVVSESFNFDNAGGKKNPNIYRDELCRIKEILDNKDELELYQYDILKSVTGFYRIMSKDDLMMMIDTFVMQYGSECSLNWIDVSGIKDMSWVFESSVFKGDISKWDVSNVINMSGMFYESEFNGDISRWDVSKVKNMDVMFVDSKFNNDISRWDVSSVDHMSGMFKRSVFNGDISKWDVSNVIYMDAMFIES